MPTRNTMQQLKYLFIATYKDGTSYEQNSEDISVKEPGKRSCFFDVDQKNVEQFTLVGDGKKFTVDLIDGHFKVNGVKFFMHDEELKDFKIVFWRRHTHSFNQGTDNTDQPIEIGHDIAYLIGWQATDTKNREVKRIMQIK